MLQLLPLLVTTTTAAPTPNLGITLSAGGGFEITVDGVTFATGAPITAVLKGESYSSSDGSLKQQGPTTNTTGADPLGVYAEHRTAWTAGTTPFETAVRVYGGNGGSTTDSVVFEQHWPNGAVDTAAIPPIKRDSSGIIAGYPALALSDPDARGYLAFGGRQLEGCYAGSLTEAGFNTGDAGGGPLSIYDNQGRTLTITTANEFMSTSWGKVLKPPPPPPSPSPVATPPPVLTVGTVSSMTSLPAGFKVLTLVVAGAGPTLAVVDAGSKLLKLYNKNATASREMDLTLSTLGVSTDNGAYYYGHTEAGKNYQQTILDMKSYSQKLEMPYQYALLDSWWYAQGKGGGVKNWTAQPKVFPDGMGYVHTQTGWKFQLHNRYWSPDNIYATQNGGDYSFIVEPGYAIPTDEKLWDDLIQNATLNGMVTYEQDWLCTEIDGMNATKQNVTLGRDWLMNMGKGAAKADPPVSIQYCMAYPRHVMQTVEISSVTQVRSSCDYHPGNTDGCSFPYCQWNVGTSSLLAYSVGLAPSKDNFWSTAEQPGNKYGNQTREPYGEMGGVITTYTTGPVAVGDGVGYTDGELVLRSCTKTSGTLLQPSRPATTIDACFFEEAFGGSVGPVAAKRRNYPVWSTHTAVSGRKWGHLIAILLAEPFKVVPAMLPLDIDLAGADDVGDGERDAAAAAATGATYLQWTGYGAVTNITMHGEFSAASPIALPKCNASDFQLYHAAPLFANKLALLGEPAKWVPVATKRIVAVDDDGTSLTVSVRGDAHESVSLAFANAVDSENVKVAQVDCTLSASGEATATFDTSGAGKC